MVVGAFLPRLNSFYTRPHGFPIFTVDLLEEFLADLHPLLGQREHVELNGPIVFTFSNTRRCREERADDGEFTIKDCEDFVECVGALST